MLSPTPLFAYLAAYWRSFTHRHARLHHRRRALITAAAACLLTGAGVSGEPISVQPVERAFDEAGQRLDSLIGSLVDAAQPRDGDWPRIHNSALVVEWPSGMRYARGVGFARAGGREPMTAAHVFPIASVTKTMTAAIVLQLWEEGRLGSRGLDATLAELEVLDRRTLNRLAVLDGVAVGPGITVRQLLGHRTGLRDVLLDDANVTSETNGGDPAPGSIGGLFMRDLDQHIACVRAPHCDPARFMTSRAWQPWNAARPSDRYAGTINFYLGNGMATVPLFRPGSGYSYSDTNYILLGLLIEKLTGQPLRQAYIDRLFAPLGMTSSFLSDGGNTPLPRGVELADFYLGEVPGTTSRLNLSFDWAGGGVMSSALDLSRFGRALATGRLFRRPETQQAMLAWHHESSQGDLSVHRGLGVSRYTTTDGIDFIGHAGYWGAFVYYEPATGIVVSGTLDQVGVPMGPWLTDVYRAAHASSVMPVNKSRACDFPQ